MRSTSGHNGEIIRSAAIAGFHFTELGYESRSSIPRHSHKHSCFCFVESGRYTEVYRSRAIECKPADLIFRPAREPHSDQFGEAATRCLVIEFDDSWIDKLREGITYLNGPGSFAGCQVVHIANRLRDETRNSDEFSELAIEGLMLELFAVVARKHHSPAELRQPRWLKAAKEVLHEDLTGRLTLTAVAEAVGVHPVYLAATFRRHYRTSVGEYVRRLRIEYACKQLVTTDSPLVDIALAAGFAHQAHFSRTFKRLTGLTPGEYRLKYSS